MDPETEASCIYSIKAETQGLKRFVYVIVTGCPESGIDDSTDDASVTQLEIEMAEFADYALDEMMDDDELQQRYYDVDPSELDDQIRDVLYDENGVRYPPVFGRGKP